MQPVCLLAAVHTNIEFDRSAFLSIAQQAMTYSNVFLHLKHADEDLAFAVRATGAQGIIASVTSRSGLDELVSVGLPCVNIANYLEAHDAVPVVGNDDYAVGRLAAEYFMERAFEHFAYFGDVENRYFLPRRDSFAAAVREAGFRCQVAPSPGSRPPAVTRPGRDEDLVSANVKRSAAWLASLPKPLAVFCPMDYEAREAINSCRVAGLSVPEEVSIIGVDNDPMLCLTVSPQLASVATASATIGRAALELIQAMLNGKRPPREPMLFPPTELVVRGSCSEQAITDRDVAAAVNFIRVHVRERLSVAAVADHVAISRRTLERRFVEILGRSPADEIRRARVAHAMRLLAESDLILPEVARRSGLIRRQRLANLVKEETGLTPLQYRRRFQRSRYP